MTWNISYELAFSLKPVNEWMAPTTARPIEFVGALPDLLFGGVIFDFNHRRPVIATLLSCNLVDVIMFFHDLVRFDFRKIRLYIRGHDMAHPVMPQPR